jgi:hypothetical protein
MSTARSLRRALPVASAILLSSPLAAQDSALNAGLGLGFAPDYPGSGDD